MLDPPPSQTLREDDHDNDDGHDRAGPPPSNKFPGPGADHSHSPAPPAPAAAALPLAKPASSFAQFFSLRRKPLPSEAPKPRSEPEPEPEPAPVPDHDPDPDPDAHAAAGSSVCSASPPGSPGEAFVVRDLDRPPHSETTLPPSLFEYHFPQPPRLAPANAALRGLTSHSRLASEPFSSPSSAISNRKAPEHQRAATMSSHGPLQPPQPMTRPPPLRVDLGSRKMSSGSNEYKQPPPKTPGSKITSFFGWKNTASPGGESSSTEISESGVSPLPSPMNGMPISSGTTPRDISRDSYSGSIPKMSRSQTAPMEPDVSSNNKVTEMENELREISSELAGSIRREMDLEDMVERLQMEPSQGPDGNRRTSDHFSDSGYGSVKYASSDAGGGKQEDVEKLKRTFEQQRAQLKVDLTQKLQEERSRRQAAESHVQILENQVSQFRREKVDASNMGAKAKELESTLEDTRRRLTEERELKDNYEDLLTAMRVELEQNRNEKEQLEERVQSELRSSSIHVRKGHIDAIAEEGASPAGRVSGGLSRSNSLARAPPARSGLSRSGSVSRPSSMIVKDREFRESLVETVKDTESQRDVLHQTVKSLLERQAYEASRNEKRVKLLEMELNRARQLNSPRRRGYERGVTGIREEINGLRRRADDALDQKWQFEKNLVGLKMDLDRAEQETSSLRTLLQEHDNDKSESTGFQASATMLEDAYRELQNNGMNGALDSQVRQRVEMNNSLKDRLAQAIGRGERDQQSSVAKINEMQVHLKQFEDALMLAQQNSEEYMGKHEQELKSLKESHNTQLQRMMTDGRGPGLPSPILPNSPFYGGRSPRLSHTTSGEGIALNQAVQTHDLESKVKELEKALRKADMEMGEVVSRMNKTQLEVGQLQTDRDDALRETRRLQADLAAER